MPTPFLSRPEPSRRHLIGLVTGLALLCGLLIGQPAPASAADTGSISGTVTVAGTGTPLVGHPVYLDFRANSGAPWAPYNAGGLTQTNASGVYTKSALPAGEYRVRVGSADELDKSYYITYYGNVTDPAAATPVAVAEGQAVTGINIARTQKPGIRGSLTGPGGALDGEGVEARRKLPGGGWGPIVFGSMVGSSANYRITLTEPGEYAVRFTADNHLSEYYNGIIDDGDPATIDSATTVVVGPSEIVTGINAQLKAYSTISGTVTKEASATTGSFGVEVLKASDRTTQVAYKFFSSGSPNAYSLKVPPGDYIVRFEPPNSNYAGQFYNNVQTAAAAQVVSVPLETTVTGINADLKLRGKIIGTVTGAGGAAVSGVRVYAYRDGVVTSGAPFVTTNAEGKYTILKDAGEYVLHFSPVGPTAYAREFYNDKRTPDAANSVTLIDGATVTADVTLEPKGSIHGVVLDPAGEPVEDAYITAISSTGGSVGELGEANTETDAQGRFELNLLVDREYKLLADHPDYEDTYFDGADTLAAAEPVVVPPGAVLADVTWQMSELGGVSGTVVDAAGDPVAGVQVSGRSYFDDGVFQGWHSEAETTTASDGTYTLRAQPGALTIFYDKAGYLPNHYPDALAPFLGEEVAFPGNGVVRTGYDAVLQSAAGVPSITNNAAPVISGTAEAGETLTASTGAWTPSDVTLHYRWVSNGVALPDTGPTLVITPDMVGGRLIVFVVATKPGHRAATAQSSRTEIVEESPSTPAVENVTPPVVTGTPAVGDVLGVDPGTWSPTPTSLGYQWYVGSVPVGGATSSTYTPQLADVGLDVSVRVTAGAASHLSGVKQSSPTEPVAYDDAQQYVQNVTKPVISGSAVVGQTLSVSTGTWDPADVTLTYRWLRNGAQIDLATTNQYTVTGSDVGARLSVRVAATKTDFVPATVTTSQTTQVPAPEVPEPPPLATAGPGISGTAIIGQTLTASLPAFATTPQLSYQWFRQGAPIPGATAMGYPLQSADAGTSITVQVTATATGYRTYTRSSPAATPKHQVALKATGKSPKKKKVTLTVTLTSATLAGLQGTASVMRGTKTLGTVTIKNGKGKLKLKKQASGKRTYTVVFAGTSALTPASVKVTVKVK